jgi:para-aminobenzoate synthetase component 1
MQLELAYLGHDWQHRGFPRFLQQEHYWVLLDSGQHQLGRYDILCGAPYIKIWHHQHQTWFEQAGQRHQLDDDPLTAIQNQLQKHPIDSDLPFNGGLIAALSYDLGRLYEQHPSQAANDLHWPELVAGLHDWALIIDHHQQRCWLCHQGQDPTRPLSWLLTQLTLPWDYLPQGYAVGQWHSNMNEASYQQGFQRIHRYLQAGDCYQVNFAQRFQASFQGDPLAAYLRLRQSQSAPFSCYWQHPQGQVLCLSPERFISLNGSQVETWPIKGTRPRCSEPLENARQIQDLLHSPKDRAENLMIVDLLRNDLSRHCDQVQVPSLFEHQQFSKVHHLVSRITGQLKSGHHPLELLRDAFPGGSITGAPKIRAMQIIEQLEPQRRSLYCGSIMYLGFNGRMDSNICIRTLLQQDQQLYCWGGGGIVADSNSASEFLEITNKVGPLMQQLTQGSRT